MYLQSRDGKQGPHSEAEVRAAYLARRYPSSTMSWKEGELAWISLGRRWGRQSGTSGHAVGWLAGISLVLFIGAGVLLPLGYWKDVLPPAFDTVAVQATLASVFAALSLALLVLFARHSTAEGRIRLPVALGSLTFVAVALVSIGVLLKASQTERLRQNLRNAAITVTDDGRVLLINGYIAQNFVRDFQEAIDGAPKLEYVQINSPGGLIEDALRAGKIVEARKIRVRVFDKCASACVLFWAASPSRELGLHGAIGLHQSVLQGDMPQQWRDSAMEQLESESTAVLKRAGFSDALLATRSSTSPDDLVWVGPMDLLREGVTTRVVDEDGNDSGQAEIVMADVLRRDGSAGDTRRLLMAYARTDSVNALAQAEAMRAAQLRGEDVTTLAARAAASARTYALSHASDAAILRWASDTEAMLSKELSTTSSNACAGYLVGTADKSNVNSQRQSFKTLADLTESITLDAPAAAANAVAAKWATSLIRTQFAELVQHRGYPSDFNAWSVRQRCDFVHDLYVASLDQRPRDAATAIRVIEGAEPDSSDESDASDAPESASQSGFDSLRDRAVAEHPQLSTTEAIKAYSTRESSESLAAKSPEEQLSASAAMFWGFYFVNTRMRVDYCAQHGVDIRGFVQAFNAAHDQELEKAQYVFSENGMDPEALLTSARGTLAGILEQDMRDITTESKLTPAQACTLINDNAESMAAAIQLPAHVKAALLTN